MTKEQEKIAEDFVSRMKRDNQSSINYMKYFDDHPNLKKNDIIIAVEALEEMRVIVKYPDSPQSVRFSEPYGSKFTTFDNYRLNKWFERNPFLEKIILVLLGAAISFIISQLSYKSNIRKEVREELRLIMQEDSVRRDASLLKPNPEKHTKDSF